MTFVQQMSTVHWIGQIAFSFRSTPYLFWPKSKDICGFLLLQSRSKYTYVCRCWSKDYYLCFSFLYICRASWGGEGRGRGVERIQKTDLQNVDIQQTGRLFWSSWSTNFKINNSFYPRQLIVHHNFRPFVFKQLETVYPDIYHITAIKCTAILFLK